MEEAIAERDLQVRQLKGGHGQGVGWCLGEVCWFQRRLCTMLGGWCFGSWWECVFFYLSLVAKIGDTVSFRPHRYHGDGEIMQGKGQDGECVVCVCMYICVCACVWVTMLLEFIKTATFAIVPHCLPTRHMLRLSPSVQSHGSCSTVHLTSKRSPLAPLSSGADEMSKDLQKKCLELQRKLKAKEKEEVGKVREERGGGRREERRERRREDRREVEGRERWREEGRRGRRGEVR